MLTRDLQMLVKSLPALSFVPQNDVFERFQELAKLFPNDHDDDERGNPINQLLLYFEHT